jgi:hypothetical protein
MRILKGFWMLQYVIWLRKPEITFDHVTSICLLNSLNWRSYLLLASMFYIFYMSGTSLGLGTISLDCMRRQHHPRPRDISHSMKSSSVISSMVPYTISAALNISKRLASCTDVMGLILVSHLKHSYKQLFGAADYLKVTVQRHQK